MKKFRLVILRNENDKDFLPWKYACENFNSKVEYRIVDLTSDNWFEEIQRQSFAYLLLKPSGLVSKFKELYDERLMILTKELKYLSYPTLNEVLIYENKRYLSFWLKAHNIPHPQTYNSYYLADSLDFIKSAKLPIAAKLNIGASAKGVEILRDKSHAIKYVNEIFSFGKRSKTGPHFKKGRLLQRAWNKLKEPGAIKERIQTYNAISSDPQKGFVLFQEYIPHNYEWRVVRIGDSFFAHKKIVIDDKASGTLIKKYENPPFTLLDFVKKITDKFQFFSQAVDIFETKENTYLVNEMQCIFGQSEAFQMKVNGLQGRYLYINGNWVFEEGNFNENQSYNLRLQYIINKLEKSTF